VKKTILLFLAKHWKEIALIVLSAVVIGKMQYDMNEMQKAYAAAKESYEQQIIGLTEIHDRELKEREEALADYEKHIAKIEKDYREGLRNAERDAQRDEHRYEREHTEAPAELIAEIEGQFGFEYVE